MKNWHLSMSLRNSRQSGTPPAPELDISKLLLSKAGDRLSLEVRAWFTQWDQLIHNTWDEFRNLAGGEGVRPDPFNPLHFSSPASLFVLHQLLGLSTDIRAVLPPEPFSGDWRRAEVLVIGMNPSLVPEAAHPTWMERVDTRIAHMRDTPSGFGDNVATTYIVPWKLNREVEQRLFTSHSFPILSNLWNIPYNDSEPSRRWRDALVAEAGYRLVTFLQFVETCRLVLLAGDLVTAAFGPWFGPGWPGESIALNNQQPISVEVPGTTRKVTVASLSDAALAALDLNDLSRYTSKAELPSVRLFSPPPTVEPLSGDQLVHMRRAASLQWEKQAAAPHPNDPGGSA